MMESTNTTTGEEGPNSYSKSSPSATTALLGIVLIYLCIIIWFLQSRYFSAVRRGPTFFSALYRQLTSWMRSISRINNHNSHNHHDNLPNHNDLDESEYTSWSVLEVASWSRSKLKHYFHSSYPTNGTITKEQYMSKQIEDKLLQESIIALVQERIDGPALEHIKLEYLSRWMPFGAAAYLMSQYDDLISTNSIRDDKNLANGTSKHTNDLPSWYSESLACNRHDNHDDNVEAQVSLSSEHVQQLMKDRFGFSLPTLSTAETAPTGDETASTLEMTGRVESSKQTRANNKHDASTVGDDNSKNLGDILNAMPPSIRAAAERRPELVAELFASRKYLHDVNKEQKMKTICEDDLANEGEEGADFDSERASLLRRRIK